MIETTRRVVLGGTAALLLQAIRDAVRGPEPVRAARRKRIKFDIPGSQFGYDCVMAGGDFTELGPGEYSCCFADWCMFCSDNTKTCRIVCDAGVKCIKPNRLPGNVGAALDKAVNQLPSAPGTDAPADAPPIGSPPGPGNVIDDDPEVVTESR
jgi:hypothetical protein